MAEGGPIGKTISSVIGTILPSVVNAFTSGGPRRQFKWNRRAAQYANEQNRKNAEWLLEQERRIQEEQRRYDSPSAQMERYIAAGLNPHMIYGSGGSAGGAFPFHAPSIPGVNVQAPDASYPDVVGPYIAASQLQAQQAVAGARVDESVMKQALIRAQTEIARVNPMLNPSVYKAVTDSMMAVADAKSKEVDAIWKTREETTESSWRRYTVGEAKVEADLKALEQRLGLNTTDQKIRNKILESKEFENMLKEIQVEWMKNAEITPQHIFQGLLLILGKMM